MSHSQFRRVKSYRSRIKKVRSATALRLERARAGAPPCTTMRTVRYRAPP